MYFYIKVYIKAFGKSLMNHMQIHWQMSVLGRSPDSDVVETEKTVN